ncbi:unnamed protein product [Leuciscus chuanchicus]
MAYHGQRGLLGRGAWKLQHCEIPLLERDLPVYWRWVEDEKNEEVSAVETMTGHSDKRDREPTPSKTPRALQKFCHTLQVLEELIFDSASPSNQKPEKKPDISESQPKEADDDLVQGAALKSETCVWSKQVSVPLSVPTCISVSLIFGDQCSSTMFVPGPQLKIKLKVKSSSQQPLGLR